MMEKLGQNKFIEIKNEEINWGGTVRKEGKIRRRKC